MMSEFEIDIITWIFKHKTILNGSIEWPHKAWVTVLLGYVASSFSILW